MRGNSEIKIKETFGNMLKEDIPEMSQEEAIKNYRADDTIGIPNKKKGSDPEDNTEETEHLNRIKAELLASLERVKKLAQKLFKDEKEVQSKLKVKEGSNGSGGSPGQSISKGIEMDEVEHTEGKERE